MAKELSEILINLSSHGGSSILKCTAFEPTCFVFDTKSGWNDAKVDLFYLAIITDMDITTIGKEPVVNAESIDSDVDDQDDFADV